jgi:hypothetical protein
MIPLTGCRMCRLVGSDLYYNCTTTASEMSCTASSLVSKVEKFGSGLATINKSKWSCTCDLVVALGRSHRSEEGGSDLERAAHIIDVVSISRHIPPCTWR